MSSIKLESNASGTGVFTIASPNSNTNRTLSIPDGTGSIVVNGVNGSLVSETAKAYNWNGLTTNTFIDFTGIPSWVKRITVMFSGVSLVNFASEGNSILVQLGDSGGIENSSYTQSSSFVGATSGIYSRSDGFHIATWLTGGNTVQGVMQIFKHSGNLFCASGIVNHSSGYTTMTAGSKTLSDTLDRIRITTANGTDTFDAGTINILYE